MLQAADRLRAELGAGGRGSEPPGAVSPLTGDDSAISGLLSPDEESLIASVRRSLAEVAAAVGAARPERRSDAVSAALDGVEMVMRGEMVSGNAGHLPSLMPGFVFLVTLPIVEQDEALELSRRTAQLIEEALGS